MLTCAAVSGTPFDIVRFKSNLIISVAVCAEFAKFKFTMLYIQLTLLYIYSMSNEQGRHLCQLRTARRRPEEVTMQHRYFKLYAHLHACTASPKLSVTRIA